MLSSQHSGSSAIVQRSICTDRFITGNVNTSATQYNNKYQDSSMKYKKKKHLLRYKKSIGRSSSPIRKRRRSHRHLRRPPRPTRIRSRIRTRPMIQERLATREIRRIVVHARVIVCIRLTRANRCIRSMFLRRV
jgi:hypothetical protein